MTAIPFALIGLLCPFVVLVIIIMVVVRLVRSSASSGLGMSRGTQTQSSNVATQLGADGFWILSCPVALSSMIYYQYWSGGTRHTAQVPYQPGPDGRQFVYTGVRPDQVSIIRIVQQLDDGSSNFIIPGIIAADAILDSSPSFDSSPPPSPPPQSNFPSAY